MKIIAVNYKSTMFTLLIFALTVLPLQAGTFDNLHFIGFSKDGKHMAFETYGTSDGSGHGYSAITLVNIAENSWVPGGPIRAGTENDGYDEEVARARNRVQAAPRLEALGIVDGATGDHVFSRRITDLTDYRGPIRFAKFLHSTYQEGDYELHLQQKNARRENCDVYAPPSRKIFTLSLKNRQANTTQILQDDNRLPNSRHCPDRYEIAEVYVSNKLLVVFLRMYGPGFEGPDMRYLAVTGVID